MDPRSSFRFQDYGQAARKDDILDLKSGNAVCIRSSSRDDYLSLRRVEMSTTAEDELSQKVSFLFSSNLLSFALLLFLPAIS
jgi:hypothetical protein